MQFYTYMWLRGNATPYYIGKGSNGRAYTSESHTVCRPKDAARILVECWASEAEAFEMEKYYIKLYGRQDNGTGILRNRTDGGDGNSNPSLETRAKQSLAGQLYGKFNATYEGRSKGARTGIAGKAAAAIPGHMSRCGHISGTKQSRIPGRMSAIGKLGGCIGGKVSTHIRWHINRGIIKEGCVLCQS